ncbi:MAG: caspase family protein [Nostocales cyanobacterium 94392]|nr:caspase family protein [Nostocales cyanobacterium 94392]
MKTISYTKRRQFIQYAASSILATMSMNYLDIMSQGEYSAQVLAQNTPRKLALLVGINAYPQSVASLKGCVNDTFLQRELLIHRFGFNPKDILTLTNAQATRKGILTAFEEHLIKQAKPGDVVFFHYSGHGSRISDKPNCDEIALKLSNICANSSLVPIDGRNSSIVGDIMGHTLFLLMSALQTEKVAVVLDSCYSGGGKRGNLIVRSYNGLDLPEPSQEELEYQRQWLGKLKLSPQEFIERRRKSIAKGIVIASAKREQLAVDTIFNDFYAGGFTYLFTQYLWQQTSNESLKRTIINVGRSTKILAYKHGNIQDPEFESNLNIRNVNSSIYLTNFSSPPADAVVIKVNNDEVEIWLGGIESQSLEAFNSGAIFTILDKKGSEKGLVKLEYLNGLVGRGKVLNSPGLKIEPGTLLQERIRSIPKDLTLKIGLDDNSLDKNTIIEAKQFLQNIYRIQPLPLGQEEVQYIFGRMTEVKYQQLQKNKILNLPLVGSFGLFLPTLDQILPGSFGTHNETVNASISRLKPKLKSLLATRIIKQILGNTNTSRVAVTASINIANNNKIVAETYPIRGLTKTSSPINQQAVKIDYSPDSNLPRLPLGTQIIFRIKSYELVPIYISILVTNTEGEMAVLYPNDWSASEGAALLGAEQTLIVPQAGVDEFAIAVTKPVGLTEAFIIASTTPLRDSLKALKQIATSRGIQTRNPIAVEDDDLLNFTNSLLDDLDRGTRKDTVAENIVSDVRGLDANKLAAMVISFEVVG